MKYCHFQLNPVYEGDIIQEVRPGEYLMSTGNQTWVRDCPDGTEAIGSCTFCIVPLHCNCWLRTDNEYLAGSLDTCLIDDIYPNVTYIPNAAFQYLVEQDKYHPDRSWEPQPNRDHESNKKYQILNANLDKVEEQWLELNKETVQPGNIIDANQVATRIRRPLAHRIFVAIVITASILGPLMLLVLALVIVLKKVVSRMKTEHLNAAGFLTALPIGKVTAAPFVETSGKLSFLDIALLAICGIIAIYIVIRFIHWCYTTARGKFLHIGGCMVEAEPFLPFCQS